MASLMNELQRKVVSDHWRHEVLHAEHRMDSLQQHLRMAIDREGALLARIDELESGPGCARELREKLELLELQLQQQQTREKQQSVFKQLLSTGAVSNNAGGAAPAIQWRNAGVHRFVGQQQPLLPHEGDTRQIIHAAVDKGSTRVMQLELPQDEGKEAISGEGGSGGPGDGTEADAANITGDDGDRGTTAKELQVVLTKLAKTQRELLETQDEARVMRSGLQERCKQLEAALEDERKARFTAEAALEATHIEAGVHEAQEMAQLRLDLTAAHEEVEFLRSRQARVHEEEHRLQMVAEMSKRLGTNVSKYELDALRSQVISLTQEAERQNQPAQL